MSRGLALHALGLFSIERKGLSRRFGATVRVTRWSCGLSGGVFQARATIGQAARFVAVLPSGLASNLGRAYV